MTRPPIAYRVQPKDPAAHLFEVVLTVPDPDPEGTVLRLPSWIPGSYMIREFARNLVRIGATLGGRPVALEKVDKDTWRAPGGEGPLVVTTEVYAWDLSVRAAHLDRTHGFFNGTSLLLAVEGRRDGPHELELVAPGDDACAGWQVATTLTRLAGEPWGFGRFRAADYDELVDHPVELGTFERVDFEACGVPHHVVVTGRVRFDRVRLAEDLAKVCTTAIRFFGEPAPMDRYAFLTTAVGDGYGGLEHRSSTALLCKRDDLPAPGATSLSEGYRGFLGLCSHEYFHTWNVKRIKPRAFAPYHYNRENHTTLLWAFEGITSYYDDLMLRRAGLIDDGSYLELVGRTLTTVLRQAGRTKQSLADASFDAWTKYYRQDENSPNALVSYYLKGSLVALALDLHLRALTDDRVSLDDVMRTLWVRYGDGRGVPEDGVEAVCAELAGADLSSFFDPLIRGTEEPPLSELLGHVGVRLGLRRATGDGDKGGAPARDDGHVPGDLGITAVDGPGGARLKHVHDHGAAREAGLSADDVVVALDGLRVDKGSLVSRVRALAPGTRVTLHAFRRDELLEVEATLGEAPATTAWLELVADADEATLARRRRWLDGRA
jgi:predicted metalloprotease with PDZ domain